MNSHFSQDMQAMVKEAFAWCKELKKRKVESSHLWLALYSSKDSHLQTFVEEHLPTLEEWLEYYIVDQGEGNYTGAYRQDAYLYDGESRSILYEADRLRRQRETKEVESSYLLEALLLEESTAQRILIDRDYDPGRLLALWRGK